jgi:tetratricopeptide (TPR) repeat protein
VPYPQSIVPPVPRIVSGFETSVLTSAAVLVLVAGWAYADRRTRPLTTFGVGWYALMLVPSIALLLLADVGQAMAEHRAYLAYCGVFIAVGGFAGTALATLRHRGRASLVAAGAVVAIVLAVLMGLSTVRIRVWGEPLRLWQEAVRVQPDGWFQNYGLADAYRSTGDLKSAAASYEKSVALYSGNADVFVDFADVLMELKQFGRAYNVLAHGLRVHPNDDAIRLRLAALVGEVFQDRVQGLALCRASLNGKHRAMAEDCVRRYETQDVPGGFPSN